MGDRKWFTKENTPALLASELATLNRAARMVLSSTTAKDLSRDDLLLLRKVFDASKSAQEIWTAFWSEKESNSDE